MTKIVERIAALRQVMEREGLGAFIFPSTDAHNSEYVAGHWKGREWISGFNGSAGTVVVTMDAAGSGPTPATSLLPRSNSAARVSC